VNYNINFTYNYTDVAYMYYSYQDYDASASCAGCSLNDTLVGINRHADTASAAGPAAIAVSVTISETVLAGHIRTC